VKWKDQNYEQATWEDVDDLSEFSAEIAKFHKLNDSVESKKKQPVGKKRFKELKTQPQYLSCTLYPFQLDGINWLRYSWTENRNVILADEVCINLYTQV
jgi:chromodomain-helicase-DNA-binding protein 4